MKKLGSVIYNKLLLQAEEAKEQLLDRIASGLYAALDQKPVETLESYSYDELNDDIHKEMWKLATHIIRYYDIQSVDAEKLNEAIEISASRFIDDLEKTLDVECFIGANEDKVPGQK